MKRITFFILVVLAADASAAEPVAAVPAAITEFNDSGKFILSQNDVNLASITFHWAADGTFENKSVLALAGQSVTQSIHITPAPDHGWLKITCESPQGTATFTREGLEAKRRLKDKDTTVKLMPGTGIYNNFAPALFSQGLRACRLSKTGRVTMPVLLMPAPLIMDATIERKDEIEQSIAGVDQKFIRYAYTIAGIEIAIWSDSRDKVYLADVPVQHAAYTREGYESLRQKSEKDPLISRATHTVDESNESVPMRDGIKLATTLYRSKGATRTPLILIRTPYKREMLAVQAQYFARRGFAVAVQDCRGRFGSPGTWEPFVHEREDGYDSVEWLAGQPWCNGKVGMIGGSYLGWVQWWAACMKPPHLVTIVPNVSPPEPFFNMPYEYGSFFLFGAIWWANILESGATADLSGAAMSKVNEKKYQSLLRSLPVIDLDKKVLGKENPYYRQWIQHPSLDDYWDRSSFHDRLTNVEIPVFHQSGWFDGDGIGTKLNYLRMAAFGHRFQKLVLGPWGHADQSSRRHGDWDFGPEATPDLQRAYLRWFDHWLKGVNNGIDREPLVELFVMGSNRWVRGNSYPLPETRFEKWFLTSQGHANTSKGDGRLTDRLPPTDNPADKYTYDPGDPTPDPDFYELAAGETKVSSEDETQKRNDYHKHMTATRPDILVFTTDRQDKPLTIAGPLSAVLFASSSAKDTDWFMRLLDVDAADKILPLAHGTIRARFRESMKSPKPLDPGKVYEYHLDLWHTGMTIQPGHRLRLEVSSAAFPMFSRNLNTGGHNETETSFVPARQTIFHDAGHPSHVLLPVIATPAAK